MIETSIKNYTEIYKKLYNIGKNLNENLETFGKQKFKDILLKIQDLDFNIQKQIILE